MEKLYPPNIVTIVDNLFSYPYLRYGIYPFNSERVYSIFVMFPSAEFLI